MAHSTDPGGSTRGDDRTSRYIKRTIRYRMIIEATSALVITALTEIRKVTWQVVAIIVTLWLGLAYLSVALASR